MKWPLSAKIGIGLMLVGVAPLISIEYYLRFAHNWTPLDVPVLFEPGVFQSPEFKTDSDARYLVVVAGDQLVGSDLTREQCMMGVGNLWVCGDVKWTMQFDWQIISDKGTVAQSGSYRPTSISGAKIGFTEFQGHRNARQRVALKILRNAGELNSHHPRLVVEAEAGPNYWKEFFILYYFSWIWAAAVVALGILIIYLAPSFRAFKRP